MAAKLNKASKMELIGDDWPSVVLLHAELVGRSALYDPRGKDHHFDSLFADAECRQLRFCQSLF
jgi:hypothetical protein